MYGIAINNKIKAACIDPSSRLIWFMGKRLGVIREVLLIVRVAINVAVPVIPICCHALFHSLLVGIIQNTWTIPDTGKNIPIL